MIEQICNKCNTLKDISKFEWAKNIPSPRKTCTKCRTLNREYSESQKIRIKEYKKKYRDSGRAKDIWEKHTYGVSKSEIAYSHCVICGGEDRLCIDHCHVSGEFRGLLCTKCNAGIGMFNDSVLLLRNAIRYIEHFKDGGDSFRDYPHFEVK